ncbi:uncharacterized protein LOC113164667 [Anabas testudineus]|uniref:uncharacterized protein LOC113164667 n=1 Tax=Anabas testudineus TaxID=64144 RepID=UPI000E462C94|nr:uncharacterized protein LOC113164667 [Anabas testudineus]
MWFVLLLPLTFCINREATHLKTTREQFITPICSDGTGQKAEANNTITLIVCKIFKRSSGEECQLLYQYGKGFEHKCGSRFKLLSKNQTVFLHLIKLTTEDSGNYTCQCTKFDGTYTLHLNITVEEDEDTSSSAEKSFNPIITSVSCVTIFIIVTGVILRYIHQKFSHRGQLEPPARHSNTEPQDFEPYDTFVQRENELYSTAGMTQL